MLPTRRYLDIHILQTVPPSNLNRDGDGMPKTARYGGKDRARVSSQSWKRATRKQFRQDEQGIRSKLLAEAIADSLHARHSYPDQDAALTAAKTGLAAAGIGGGKKTKAPTGELGYLLLFGHDLADKMADAIIAGDLTDKAAKQLIADADMPLALALFGRMVADDKHLSVDASCQVAHALSTHEVSTELDYFTAVDDLNTADAGAGMIGDIGFNSATLYRYATVNLDALQANLGGPPAAADAAHGAVEFLRCFAESMPTGYANSFANHTLPSVVAVSYRTDRPVNLVGAFEAAVTAADSGYLETSATRLAAEARAVEAMFGPAERSFLAHRVDHAGADLAAAFGQPTPFPQLLDAVRDHLTNTSTAPLPANA